MFAGEQFDNAPEFRLVKSLLLDFFRGRQVDGINLKVAACFQLHVRECAACHLFCDKSVAHGGVAPA